MCDFHLVYSFAELKAAAFAPGDVWGFNLARVRIGSASKYAQW